MAYATPDDVTAIQPLASEETPEQVASWIAQREAEINLILSLKGVTVPVAIEGAPEPLASFGRLLAAAATFGAAANSANAVIENVAGDRVTHVNLHLNEFKRLLDTISNLTVEQLKLLSVPPYAVVTPDTAIYPSAYALVGNRGAGYCEPEWYDQWPVLRTW